MVVTKNLYKESELGPIPYDWKIEQLSNIGRFSKGQGIRKDQALDGEIPCVRYGELYTRHNNYIKQYYSFITREISETSKKLKQGDILFAGSGETKEEIGKCAAFIDNIEAYAGGDVIILSPIEIPSLFLGYLLNAPIIQKQKASKGQGDAIVHISANQLGSIQIPIPTSKSEQIAIATALSDVDALIENLEELIAKKRDLKQGLILKLTKPKGDWETKSLGELARYRRGSFPQPYGLGKWYDDVNGIPFVQVFDVDENWKLKYTTKRKISIEAQSMSVFIKKGSIVLTIQGSIGRIALTQYDAYLDRTLLYFESFTIPFNRYFFMLMVYLLFEKEKEKAPGGTIKTITKEALSSFIVSYPKIEIQNQIAEILSDVDNEIELLESKLIKYRAVKIGMMQELLTGKIRLV